MTGNDAPPPPCPSCGVKLTPSGSKLVCENLDCDEDTFEVRRNMSLRAACPTCGVCRAFGLASCYDHR